jgi:DNA-binding transcriptional MocR family regulator
MAFLYETVAAALEERIGSGELRPGERTPSVRKVCSNYQVSLATAVQALSLLERRGLVEARPQSGFYVTASATAAPPEPECLKARAAVVETGSLINEVVASARDHSLAPLGAATIAGDLLPGAQIYRSVAHAMRTLGADGHGYEIPPGNEDLRRQIAKRMAATGVKTRAGEVVITTGSMEAISLALRVVAKAGDSVAIESPMFYGIVELLCSLGLKAVEIPVDPHTGMDLGALERTLKARRLAAVLAIPNFNNPAGSLMPDAHKKKLVELLAREGVPLIEDDIYGDIAHDGSRPTPAKAFDKTGQVLYCASFSKTLSPGLRVGWIVPGRFQEAIERVKFATTIATSTLPQAAVAHYLEQGGYDRHLRRLRGQIKTRVAQYRQAIARLFPPGTRVSDPKGGFVLWVQFPDGVDATRVYRAARARGVSVVPGPSFACGFDRFASYMRISCGSALTPSMEKALAILGEEASTPAR